MFIGYRHALGVERRNDRLHGNLQVRSSNETPQKKKMFVNPRNKNSRKHGDQSNVYRQCHKNKTAKRGFHTLSLCNVKNNFFQRFVINSGLADNSKMYFCLLTIVILCDYFLKLLYVTFESKLKLLKLIIHLVKKLTPLWLALMNFLQLVVKMMIYLILLCENKRQRRKKYYQLR